MKKLLALLLTVCMLSICLLSAGCSGGSGNGNETGKDSGTAATPAQSDEPTGTTGGEPAESAEQTDAVTEPSTPTNPDFPAFDKTQPWDGINGCIEWYINGDERSAYEISDAYDFYGFSLLVNMSGMGKNIYYDPNYMVIYDTNGDGELSDEAGYDENERITIGDVFGNQELVLMNDIDLNNQVWTPIGSCVSFRGFFNGQGHTIKNFRVTTETARHYSLKTFYYYSLFGALAYAAEARDFTIENETIEVELAEDATNVYAGGAAAFLHNVGGGILADITINGLTIKLSGKVGGAGVYIGAIAGQHNNTQVQTNIHVTDYEFVDEHTDGDIHTQPDNFQGGDGKFDLFTNCTVELKK